MDQLLGRTMMDCHPGIDDTEMFGSLRHVMESRQPRTLRNEFAYPSGERRWFDLIVDPVPDGICVLSLDVTERHHARRMDAIGQLARPMKAVGTDGKRPRAAPRDNEQERRTGRTTSADNTRHVSQH